METKTRVAGMVESLASTFRACHADAERALLLVEAERGLELLASAAHRLDAKWLELAGQLAPKIGLELAVNREKGTAAIETCFPELSAVARPIGGLAQLLALVPLG